MTIRNTLWISALLAAGMCIAVCGLTTAASPQLPCEFFGTVSVQGSPAPVGTIITAYVNGTLQGSITITETGSFGGLGTFDERLIVMAGENDFANGVPEITFKVNGTPAAETASYQPGASSRVNLTVGAGSVTSPPVQAAPQGNASPEVPVIVAQVSAQAPTPAPTPAITPVQNQSPQPVQTVNVTTPVQ